MSTMLFTKDGRSEAKPHSFRLGQSYENFHSQLPNGGKVASIEIDKRSHTRTTSSTVMIKSNNNKPTASINRGKSNLSSGKLTSAANISAPSKSSVPRTPQTQNKLKMQSARKYKSNCQNSLFEEVAS